MKFKANFAVEWVAVVSGMTMMCEDFYRVAFSHTCRQGNRPAHLLAKYGLCIVDFIVWMKETPCFVEQALNYDILFLL